MTIERLRIEAYVSSPVGEAAPDATAEKAVVPLFSGCISNIT
jgi:hypothetical protein